MTSHRPSREVVRLYISVATVYPIPSSKISYNRSIVFFIVGKVWHQSPLFYTFSLSISTCPSVFWRSVANSALTLRFEKFLLLERYDIRYLSFILFVRFFYAFFVHLSIRLLTVCSIFWWFLSVWFFVRLKGMASATNLYTCVRISVLYVLLRIKVTGK